MLISCSTFYKIPVFIVNLNLYLQLMSIVIQTEKTRRTIKRPDGNWYSPAPYVCSSWSERQSVSSVQDDNVFITDVRLESFFETELVRSTRLCRPPSNPAGIMILLHRRIFVEQSGDSNRRLASPYRLRQFHDITMRAVGGLKTGHSVYAVRLVQGRSVGRPDVRPSHLGGHRYTLVLGRRADHKHVVFNRRWHYANHIRRRTLRQPCVSVLVPAKCVTHEEKKNIIIFEFLRPLSTISKKTYMYNINFISRIVSWKYF